MKKLILTFLVSSLLIIGSTSCSKNKEISCNLSKGEQTPMDMEIVFTATQTGDAVISSLYYKAGDKEETIINPYLPWTLTENIFEGDEILITATGTTKDGSLTITYDGKSGGFEISGSDGCSNTTD